MGRNAVSQRYWLSGVMLLAFLGQADAEPPIPYGTETTVDELRIFEMGEAGTRGDPEVAPSLWQRTWGVGGISVLPAGSKMAPNGVPYDPLFTLDLLLNVALTRNRDLYLFVESRFWAQKPGDGITNPGQGRLDFSKRQFDLDGGFAWNYLGPLEIRGYLYSDNNLNRGTSFEKPKGYNDGFAIENRYYLPGNNFDRGLYRFLGIGYYPTKELIGADGRTFKPSLFLNGSVALDIFSQRLYAYTEFEFITRRPLNPKLLLIDAGFAFRPFSAAPEVEFRLGADNNIDLDLGYTRTFAYGSVRIVW